MSEEGNSGPGTPRENTTAPPPGVGARSTVSGAHGGRRQVRAQAQLRPPHAKVSPTASPPPGSPATAAPGGGASGFPQKPSGAPAPRKLVAYQEEPERPTENAGSPPPSKVAPADAAAAAARLTNPDAQRRIVASGSSNPLHIWGQESNFFKSHFFQRRRGEEAEKEGGGKEPATALRELQVKQATYPTGAVGWDASATGSPKLNSSHHRPFGSNDNSRDTGMRIYGSGVSSQATAQFHDDDGIDVDDAYKIGGNEAEGPSRKRSGLSYRSQGRSGADGGGSGGGGGRRGEGDHLLSTSDTSDNTPPEPPKGPGATSWASLSNLRTRNINALRAYSWDQRAFLPTREGLLAPIWYLFASPRFWEKVDWSFRGSTVAILPTLILCLEPATANIFPMPTSVVFLAYWTTQPTLGAGLRETFTVLKAFCISLAYLVIVVTIHPGPQWLTILILFFSLAVGAFVAQQLRVMIAYCFASLMMQYVANSVTTDYVYIGNFYVTLFIGQAFAIGALVFPYIRWSSENARRYIIVMGDAISLSVHGACCSFWVEGNLLERQLHVSRLRQLRHTIEVSMAKAEKGLSEMGYEPHSGVYTTRLKTRMSFLKNVFNIIQSMTLVIEQITSTPALIETPMCRAFGDRIREELGVAAAAMDAMLLRIVDLDELVSEADFEAFSAAKTRYEDAVSSVRDEVILSNENYRTDNSDILLGFFLFSVEELMETINKFRDAEHCPSNLWYFLTFPLRDLQSLWFAFVELYHAIKLRHSITRRLKEGIKLSLCVALAAYFQTYALKNSATNPVVGVDTIAFLYRSTGGESFQYGQGRLMGTVLGCLTGLLGVRLANGRRSILYVCTLILTFAGSYIQASPEYGALGNGMSNGVISVVLQYTDQDGAITRIQQNCFSVIIYFIVTSVVWPVRCQTRVKSGFDGSMRMGREVTDRLLRNLDLPHSAAAVSSDALELLVEMQKKVGQQLQNMGGARAEPTMDSAEFPEVPWRMLLSAQRKLVATLLMMRYAYSTFMTSTIADAADETDGAVAAVATSISVHWVVLHRISPYTRQLSELFYEAMEVYLLLMSKVTFVPTAELTRLRLGMMQCYDRIVAVYIETIQHELRDDGASSEDLDGFDELNGEDSAAGNGAKAEVKLPVIGGGAAVVPAGAYVPVISPSGLVVDTALRDNSSFVVPMGARRSGGGNGAPQRSSSGLSKSGGSQRSRGTNNTNRGSSVGRISYKLTPAERQRLREYVLGQCTAAATASTASATATGTSMEGLAALRGMGGPIGGAPVNANSFVGGLNFTNASMFNLNGTFFNRNASMFDSALLRNAGIAVAAPVHEEPRMMASSMRSAQEGSRSEHQGRHRRGADGQASAGASTTMHSTLRSSIRNGFRQLRGRSHTDPDRSAVVDDASSESEMPEAVTVPILPIGAGLDISILSDSAAGEPATAPPSLGQHHLRRRDTAGQGEQQQRDGDGRSLHSSMNVPAPPSASVSHSLLSAASAAPPPAPAPSAPETSTAATTWRLPQHAAPPPSVLVQSAVLSAEVHLAITTTPAALARTMHAAPSVNSGAALPTGSFAQHQHHDPPQLPQGDGTHSVANNTGLVSTSSMLMSGGAGASRVAGGDVFALNRTARQTLRPGAATVGGGSFAAPHGAAARQRGSGDGHGRGRRAGEEDERSDAASASSRSVTPRREDSTHSPQHGPSFAGPPAAASQQELKQGSRTTPGQPSAERDDARRPPPAAAAAHRVPGTRGLDSDSSQKFSPESTQRHAIAKMFAEAAGGSYGDTEDAATKDSPRQPSPGGGPEGRGTLLSATSDEGDDREAGEGPWGIHTDKRGHLLSDTSNELLGSMTTTAHLSRPTHLPTTLPIPTAAKAHGSDGRGASSADATEESVERAAGSATNPYPTAFTNNASFTASGPAIPEALRAYVEGLAAHQQQQAPPPAALLGNASFIQLSSNLPAITGAFQRTMEATAGMGSAAGATTAVPPDMSATGAAVPPTGRSMSSGGAAAAANQLGSSVFASGEASSPLGGRAGNSSAQGGGGGNGNRPSSLEDTSRRGSGLNNSSNFVDLLRSFAGTQSFNPALLRMLQGEDGTAGSAGVEEDVGDEYVLTNSDIHSLEAFLFGLRALIGQVEELERSLLEVVHGTEMAKKL